MDVYRSLQPFTAPSIALTIGSFDGVHLGHRTLLKQLKERGTPVVVTFENHPAEVVRPHAVPPRLCSTEHKLKLLEESGVEATFLLRFTKELSQLTGEQFLQEVHRYIPFDTVLLGPDATLGKDKTTKGFERIEALAIAGVKVSSSLIREKIRAGDLLAAKSLLGRPFSIYAPIRTGVGLGKKIGFPTLNISVAGLCLPPLGVYAVTLNGRHGVANLGVAPTVRKDLEPTLEVHLFDPPAELEPYSEVVFEHYLRPEQKFESIDQLKAQIARDVSVAKQFFN